LFLSRIDEVRQLSFSEDFIRLWNYYLCYCEAAFTERRIGVLQIQFDKPECQRDMFEEGRDSFAEQSRSVKTEPLIRSYGERWFCER